MKCFFAFHMSLICCAIIFDLVDLVQGYRDMATYRKVFSVVKNPPYCQVTFTEI